MLDAIYVIHHTHIDSGFTHEQPIFWELQARYHILPYAGNFDEARAQRLAAEAAHARPLLQHMGEAPHSQALPLSGTLLHLPEPPVVVMSLSRTADSLTLVLFNASDASQSAVVRSALLTIQRAWQCDLFGQPVQELPTNDHGIEATIESRRLSTLKIETTSTN